METQFSNLPYFLEFFETLSESISYYESEETNNIESQPQDKWTIEVYFKENLDLEKLQQQVNELCRQFKIDSTRLAHNEIELKDWVSEVQQSFKPIIAEKFFVYPSNFNGLFPDCSKNIQMDAGCAFGTGEHATTSNCLKAISSLQDNNFINCLDMGTGSGILAIAIAKLWPNQITAVDIDEQAVIVARENFHNNQVGFIACEKSDGYNSKFVTHNSPYQLITANILANPLIEMAEDAYNNLQTNGFLIISGFLNKQKVEVLKAHNKVGFIYVDEFVQDEWPALLLKKL